MSYGSKLRRRPTNYHLLAAQQDSYKKTHIYVAHVNITCEEEKRKKEKKESVKYEMNYANLE